MAALIHDAELQADIKSLRQQLDALTRRVVNAPYTLSDRDMMKTTETLVALSLALRLSCAAQHVDAGHA
jgi:hypothetical protein